MQPFHLLVLVASIVLVIIYARGVFTHEKPQITTYPDAIDPAAIPGSQSYQTSAPFYPSPWMSGTGDWASAYEQAIAFVSQLTLLEKVNLTTGVG